MGQVWELLREKRWGLRQSRLLAREIGDYKPSLRALVYELFGQEAMLHSEADGRNASHEGPRAAHAKEAHTQVRRPLIEQNDYNGHFRGCEMASWGIAELKAKASEVIEKAQKKGPQEITKNGRPVAVVVSMEEWKAEYDTDAPKGSLAEFFQRSPLRGSGIKIGRVRLSPRHVDF